MADLCAPFLSEVLYCLLFKLTLPWLLFLRVTMKSVSAGAPMRWTLTKKYLLSIGFYRLAIRSIEVPQLLL